jgi:protein subunit release factor B
MDEATKKIYNKIYYETNKEKLRLDAKERYQKNRKARIEQMKAYNKKKLTLTENQKNKIQNKHKMNDYIKKISKHIVLDFN